METITIGTCTADEQETLDKLFHLGITSSTTAETKDTTTPSNLPASESETARSYDPSILDISESTPQPSTSSATTSRWSTVKAKASKTKIPVKLDTLDDQPPVDILLPPEIDPDFESEKSDDPETSPDKPTIEEPKCMKLYKTYIKSNQPLKGRNTTKN